ncbi:MAG: ribonuclease P protein subunit [Nanoarchaeota archaeon]|nr:ribonuclease P protein subunit [Nanoarchaeota archaeon]
MQWKARDIPRAEFIGRTIEVVGAENPSLIGIKGKIVNDTKSTFEIEKKDGQTKKLVKKQVTIKTKIQGKTVIIEGEILQGKPEERLKKKIKI